jgi:branched-chain amino acid transport system permease protein
LNGFKRGFGNLGVWGLAILAVWILDLFVVPSLEPYYLSIVMFAGVNMILATSLNLVNGFTGQFSMGHAGFMAVGAYVSAFLTTSIRSRWPEIFDMAGVQTVIFLGALGMGGLAASIVGYAVGLPSLRLKGDYLAIVTLGFGEIIRVVLLNMNVVGAARGMPGIPALTRFGWLYSFVIITVFTLWRLVTSAHGRTWLSVREDEIAAEAMGVHTTRAKVRAFVLGAFFAGLGGGLFAHYLCYLNPATFDFNRSFEFIIMVVLGGMGSLSGSIVAAGFLTVIREALRPLQEITRLDFRMVIYALLLIVLMLTRPKGVFGNKEIRDLWPFRAGRKSPKKL